MPRLLSLITGVAALLTGPGASWGDQWSSARPQLNASTTRSPTPYSDLIAHEAATFGVPPELVAAVIRIESGFNPSALGAVGEIGLMQIRPETAAMLGFTEGLTKLAEPEINIRLGVRYLAKAWQLTNGDLCRTLIKYRAGHAEERETLRSARYCQRAREYLGGTGFSAYAPLIPSAPELAGASTAVRAVSMAVRRGTPQASRRFWAAHEARVRALRLAVRAKWARLAETRAHN